jgi:hypothetical protein
VRFVHPVKLAHIPISEMRKCEEPVETLTIPIYQPENKEFMTLVHITLLRGDIVSHAHYKEVNVNEQKAIDCVLDSLYMFLNLMLGGQQLLEVDVEEVQNDTRIESLKQCRILNIGQDIVYSVSRGKQMTPKHLRLGSALHQATRSKKLAQLFHNAGNAVS